MENMSLQQQATFVIDTLARMELPTANTRLDSMRRVLKRGYISPDNSDFPIAQEALLDIPMIAFVLNQREEFPQKELKAKLRLLVQDSPLPEQAQTSSPGRDAQSELYIAAVCKNAGMNATLGEPDVIVDLNGQQYGLAVKRLKSESKIKKRFKDAANQIEKSGLPGFIVLDIRQAFNPENTKVQATGNELYTAFRGARKYFVDNHYDKMKEWQRGREIRGVIFMDHIIRLDREWGADSLTYSVNLSQNNQRRTREFDGFIRDFKKGLPNLARGVSS